MTSNRGLDERLRRRWVLQLAGTYGWVTSDDHVFEHNLVVWDPENSTSVIDVALSTGAGRLIQGDIEALLRDDNEIELAMLHRGCSILELQMISVLSRGKDVREWPEDEAAAYRDHGGFESGNAAVMRLRAQKMIKCVKDYL